MNKAEKIAHAQVGSHVKGIYKFLRFEKYMYEVSQMSMINLSGCKNFMFMIFQVSDLVIFNYFVVCTVLS